MVHIKKIFKKKKRISTYEFWGDTNIQTIAIINL